MNPKGGSREHMKAMSVIRSKPCTYCGNPMEYVSRKKLYCDECQGHQAWRVLKHRYGVDMHQYKAMLLEQNGVCAVCLKSEGQKKRMHLSIDHNHVTGKIRGLLCNRCNSSIGKFEDNITLIRAAANYLEKYD